MTLMIQDPAFSNSMKLGEALIDASKIGIEGAGAFAFVEENGINLFFEDPAFIAYISKHKFQLIIGTDSITDPKAVKKLRDYCQTHKNLNVYAYIHDSRKYLFHPKICWFKTKKGGISIIGSGNLTERGLFHNIEMYSVNELTNQELLDVQSRWNDWIDESISSNYLFDIDDPIVDHAVNLSATRGVKALGTRTNNSTQPPKVLTDLYSHQPKITSIRKSKIVSANKSSQVPKKSSKIISQQVPQVLPVKINQIQNSVWQINDSDRILVAEVPKSGTRWKQVNFDKDSFQNFFGAVPNGMAGTYLILLKEVDNQGNLASTESRPSVSVASHNFRFEVNAATGLPYPTGNKRPLLIFTEVSTRSFLYELIMPGDSRYTEVAKFVSNWKKTNNQNKAVTRIITDVKNIKPYTPNLGLWKV